MFCIWSYQIANLFSIRWKFCNVAPSDTHPARCKGGSPRPDCGVVIHWSLHLKVLLPCASGCLLIAHFGVCCFRTSCGTEYSAQWWLEVFDGNNIIRPISWAMFCGKLSTFLLLVVWNYYQREAKQFVMNYECPKFKFWIQYTAVSSSDLRERTGGRWRKQSRWLVKLSSRVCRQCALIWPEAWRS